MLRVKQALPIPPRVDHTVQTLRFVLLDDPKQLQHEHQIKFILALVKSERYTPAEMYAILRVSLCQKF